MKYANLRINLSFLSTLFFIKKENQKKQWGLLDYSVKNFNSNLSSYTKTSCSPWQRKNSLFQTITEGPMSVVQTPRAT